MTHTFHCVKEFMTEEKRLNFVNTEEKQKSRLENKLNIRQNKTLSPKM